MSFTIDVSVCFQIFQKFGLNQLLHLEISGVAWSAGLADTNSSLTFYLMYGGFQMVCIDVARDAACRRDDAWHTSIVQPLT